jgi:hypothetical protein
MTPVHGSYTAHISYLDFVSAHGTIPEKICMGT